MHSLVIIGQSSSTGPLFCSSSHDTTAVVLVASSLQPVQCCSLFEWKLFVVGACVAILLSSVFIIEFTASPNRTSVCVEPVSVWNQCLCGTSVCVEPVSVWNQCLCGTSVCVKPVSV